MTITEALAELRLFQAALDPEKSEKDAVLRTAVDTLIEKHKLLLESLRERSGLFLKAYSSPHSNGNRTP